MPTAHCDGCNQTRSDVRSVGRDDNGDPDAPDMCFLCRKELARGRVFDRRSERYVPLVVLQEQAEVVR